MKKATGRAVPQPIEFDYEQFLEDVKSPPTDLWLRHLATDQRMLADFQRYLNLQIGRAEAHAMQLKGPEMSDDLLRLQGGARCLATIRLFVASFLKNQSEPATKSDPKE